MMYPFVKGFSHVQQNFGTLSKMIASYASAQDIPIRATNGHAGQNFSPKGLMKKSGIHNGKTFVTYPQNEC